MPEAQPMLQSKMCTQEQLELPAFQDWAERLGETRGRLHRKIWEYCFIAEALSERDLLRPGVTGLGFAVGSEPLASLFCSLGVQVLATDMDAELAKQQGWVDTNQHASGLETLNTRDICPSDTFAENCSFRPVDMNAIPDDLRQFDFVWSSCAFEHLGSIDHGLEFVYQAMSCLKPGGVAVHTTEFNCASDDDTVAEGQTVIFRRRDFEALAIRLRADGYEVDLDFSDGTLPADQAVDAPPYGHQVHLKIELGQYVTSSYGLVIRKPAEGKTPSQSDADQDRQTARSAPGPQLPDERYRPTPQPSPAPTLASVPRRLVRRARRMLRR